MTDSDPRAVRVIGAIGNGRRVYRIGIAGGLRPIRAGGSAGLFYLVKLVKLANSRGGAEKRSPKI